MSHRIEDKSCGGGGGGAGGRIILPIIIIAPMNAYFVHVWTECVLFFYLAFLLLLFTEHEGGDWMRVWSLLQDEREGEREVMIEKGAGDGVWLVWVLATKVVATVIRRIRRVCWKDNKYRH